MSEPLDFGDYIMDDISSGSATLVGLGRTREDVSEPWDLGIYIIEDVSFGKEILIRC